MKPEESLYTKIEEPFAFIEFAHPNANAMSQRLLQRLSETFDLLSKNDDISVIILKSEGNKTFCSGANLSELIAINSTNQATSFFGGFVKVLLSMHRCKKIIIGRVQGKAIGGGVGLIASCDYVMATENALVKLSEISIGIAPMVIEPVVKRKIGVSGFIDLSLNPNKWKNAYDAKSLGLYNRIFETSKDMDEALHFFLKELSAYSLLAIKNLKFGVNEGFHLSEDSLMKRAELSGEMALSPSCKKSLKRFKKK